MVSTSVCDPARYPRRQHKVPWWYTFHLSGTAQNHSIETCWYISYWGLCTLFLGISHLKTEQPPVCSKSVSQNLICYKIISHLCSVKQWQNIYSKAFKNLLLLLSCTILLLCNSDADMYFTVTVRACQQWENHHWRARAEDSLWTETGMSAFECCTNFFIA